jgi:hypothetical protein
MLFLVRGRRAGGHFGPQSSRTFPAVDQLSPERTCHGEAEEEGQEGDQEKGHVIWLTADDLLIRVDWILRSATWRSARAAERKFSRSIFFRHS